MAASVHPSLHNWLTGCLDYCTETNQIRVRNFAAPEPELVQLQQDLDALNYGIAYIDAPLMHNYLQTYQDLANVLAPIYSARTWLNLNMHELSQLYRQRQLQPQHLITLQAWCTQAQIPNFTAYSTQGQQLLAGTQTSQWRIPELLRNQLQLVTVLPPLESHAEPHADSATVHSSDSTINPSTDATTPDIFAGLIQRGTQLQLNSMPFVSRGYLRYPETSTAQRFNLGNELLAGTLEELNLLSHRLLSSPVVSYDTGADPILALHQVQALTAEETLENQALLLQAYDLLNQLSPQGLTLNLDREQITQQYAALQQRRAESVETETQAPTQVASSTTALPSYARARWEANGVLLQPRYHAWNQALELVHTTQAPWEQVHNATSEFELTQFITNPLTPEQGAHSTTTTNAGTNPTLNTAPSTPTTTLKEYPFRTGAELGITYVQSTTFKAVNLEMAYELLEQRLANSRAANSSSDLRAQLAHVSEHVTPLLWQRGAGTLVTTTEDGSTNSLESKQATESLPAPGATVATRATTSNIPESTPQVAQRHRNKLQPKLVNGFGTLVVNGQISNSRLLTTSSAPDHPAQLSTSPASELANDSSATAEATLALEATLAAAGEATPLELPAPSDFLNADYLNLDFTSGKFNPTNLGSLSLHVTPELNFPSLPEDTQHNYESLSTPWMEEPDLDRRALRVLKECFGYGEFRGLQEQVIHKILKGEDVLAIMATGAGKSLCYQIPALCQPGCALVISPLIALMEDQVQQLRERGIPAASITTRNSQDTWSILQQVRSGQLKFLYLAPERAISEFFLSMLNALPINLIAIDEAHCVINWGHHFRPDYIYLHRIRECMHRQVPILACTATARRDTRLGIIEKLALRRAPETQEHNVLVGDFNRPNIEINVENFDNIGAKKAAFKKLIAKCEKPAIVYCHGRKTVEAVTEQLRSELQLNATMYHAGLNVAQRDKNQHDFIHGDCNVIVATIAFGMGIDKSDIRTIIHYDYPSSLESYYQEIGRAGRDGAPSRAYLLSDISNQRFRKRIIVQQAITELRFKSIPQEDAEYAHIIRNLTEAQITGAIEAGTPLRELARQHYEQELQLRGIAPEQSPSTTTSDEPAPSATPEAEQALTTDPATTDNQHFLAGCDLNQCFLDFATLPTLPLYARADLPLELFKLSEELPEPVMELALTLQQTAQQLSTEHFLQVGKQLLAQPQYAPLLTVVPDLVTLLEQTPYRDGLETTLAQLPPNLRDQLAQLYALVAQLHHTTQRLRTHLAREYRNGNPWGETALAQDVARAQQVETSATSAATAEPFTLGWNFTPAQLIAFLHAQQVHTRAQQEAQASPFAPPSTSSEEIQIYWNLLLRALVVVLQHLATQLESCLSNEQLHAELNLSAPQVTELLHKCATYRLAPLTLHPSEIELSLEFLQSLRNYITETQFRTFTAGNEALSLSAAVWHFGQSLNLWQAQVGDTSLPTLAQQVLQHNFAPQVLRTYAGAQVSLVTKVGKQPSKSLATNPEQALKTLTRLGWKLEPLHELHPTQELSTAKIAELHQGMWQFTLAHQQRVTANLLAGWHLVSQTELLTHLPWQRTLGASWVQSLPATKYHNSGSAEHRISLQLDPYTNYLLQQASHVEYSSWQASQEAAYYEAEYADELGNSGNNWDANSLRSAATIFNNPAYQSSSWSVSPTSCLYLEMAQHLYQEYRVATQQAKQTATIISQNVQLTPQETLELNLNYLNEVFNFAKSSNCRRKVLLAVFGQEMKQDCQHCDTCREKSPSVDLSFDLYYAIILTTLLQGKAIRPVLLNILTGQDQQYFVEGSAAFNLLGIPLAQLQKSQASIAKIARRTFRYAPQYWSQVLDYALELGYIAKDNLKGYLNATPAGRELVNTRQPVSIRTKTSLDKRDIYLEALRKDLNLVLKNLRLRHTLTQQSLEALAKELPTTKEELAQIPGFTPQLIETRKAGAYILKTLQLYRHRLAQRNPLLRASEIK